VFLVRPFEGLEFRLKFREVRVSPRGGSPAIDVVTEVIEEPETAKGRRNVEAPVLRVNRHAREGAGNSQDE
jgi:hypothetical protein